MDTVQLRRHDLLSLSDRARQLIYEDVVRDNTMWPEDEIRRLVRDGYNGVLVPGIVRRQDAGVRGLGIGMSSPYRRDGMRLRVAASVPEHEIGRVLNPYQVAARARETDHRDLPVFEVLEDVLDRAREYGLSCGVFGSLALEVVTGLPYCHDESDVDAIVRYEDREMTERFYEALRRLERSSGIRIDTELELRDGSAVKLKEFCSPSSSVLVKGFNDVRLCAKDEVAIRNCICS